MQIRKDENGNIIQVASMGGIQDGTEHDLSDYRMDENGNLLLDTEMIQTKHSIIFNRLHMVDAKFNFLSIT